MLPLGISLMRAISECFLPARAMKVWLGVFASPALPLLVALADEILHLGWFVPGTPTQWLLRVTAFTPVAALLVCLVVVGASEASLRQKVWWCLLTLVAMPVQCLVLLVLFVLVGFRLRGMEGMQ